MIAGWKPKAAGVQAAKQVRHGAQGKVGPGIMEAPEATAAHGQAGAGSVGLARRAPVMGFLNGKNTTGSGLSHDVAEETGQR